MSAARLPLSNGGYALIDCDLLEVLRKRSWRKMANGYVVCHERRNGKAKSFLLHRVVLGLADSPYTVQAHHINHDTLDNRRSNLRVCTNSQNNHNRQLGPKNNSGFKGVSRRKDCNRWHAKITVNDKQMYLGLYPTAEEAAQAYDEAASAYFGDFAWLNFPTTFPSEAECLGDRDDGR